MSWLIICTNIWWTCLCSWVCCMLKHFENKPFVKISFCHIITLSLGSEWLIQSWTWWAPDPPSVSYWCRRSSCSCWRTRSRHSRGPSLCRRAVERAGPNFCKMSHTYINISNIKERLRAGLRESLTPSVCWEIDHATYPLHFPVCMCLMEISTEETARQIQS